MRTPSRYLFQPLPPSPRSRFAAATIVTLLCTGTLYFIGHEIYRFYYYGEPLIILLLLAVAFIFVNGRYAGREVAEKRRALAAGRAGQNICQFARAFDIRQVDSWAIRAVWNVLSDELEHTLPLRAQDRLEEDLDLVGDALDLESLFIEAAWLCGRDLTDLEHNPFLPIITAHDMVLALNAQPMTQQRLERLCVAL